MGGRVTEGRIQPMQRMETDMNVTLQDAMAFLSDDEYTLYKVSRVVKAILEANGQDVPNHLSQMIYNYGRNGMIVPKVKLTGPALRPVTKQEVAEFVVKYCNSPKRQFVLPSTDGAQPTESVEEPELTNADVNIVTDEVDIDEPEFETV